MELISNPKDMTGIIAININNKKHGNFLLLASCMSS